MENNGRGIFYGVIGVATLVVAIIGATFAFFSASAGSQNQLSASGAEVGLTWAENAEKILPNLIPIEVKTGTAEKRAAFVNEIKSTGNCVDNNGYNVCSVYEFTVGNDGSVAQDIRPTLNISTFTFDKKLKPEDESIVSGAQDNFNVAIFKGGMDSVSTTSDFTTVKELATANPGDLVYQHTFTSADLNLDEGKSGAIELTALNEQLALGGGSSTYTVVFWIEETGAAQDYDQGDAFVGSISYLTTSGAQVKGSLLVGTGQ